MRNTATLLVFLLVAACGKDLGSVLGPLEEGFNAFVGSETCARCHSGIAMEFGVSGHPNMLRPASTIAQAPHLGLPEIPLAEFPGFNALNLSAQDIRYVLGGVNWKARFITREGYIIVGPQAQWALATEDWRKYGASTWSADTKAYSFSCFRCHTTGASPEGSVPGMPATSGSFAMEGVQCEACHGMGYRHVKYREELLTSRSLSLCAQCHNRNTSSEAILGKGNFIGHRDQVNELRASAHYEEGMTCVSCHNPHVRAKFGIPPNLCESCHGAQAREFEGSVHWQVGVQCTDCHMAEIIKNGTVLLEDPARGVFRGDGKSHVFRITDDANYPMLVPNPDPETSGHWPVIMNTAPDANGQPGPFLTLGYVCGKCHTDRTPQEFADVIERMGAHEIRSFQHAG